MPIPQLPYSDEDLFDVCNIVLPCWIMLVILPQNKLTQMLCMLSTLVLCTMYSALIIPMLLEGGLGFKDFLSLQGVARLMSNAKVVLPCWVHFSVSDLWVGRWIALDAAGRKMPRILMAPILFASMMLGPVGLGVYLLLRAFFKAPTRPVKRD